jgi:hypothetical protein
MLSTAYQTTQGHTPENNFHCHENLTLYIWSDTLGEGPELIIINHAIIH